MYYWLIHLKQECFSSPLKKKKNNFHIHKSKVTSCQHPGKEQCKNKKYSVHSQGGVTIST